MKSTMDFIEMKKSGEKITMLTAYDYPSARQAEAAGIDMILVGDSLGMTVLGYASTVEVTLEDMIHHARAVRRGAPDTYIVVDMPFGTYHASHEEAVKNAIKLYQESGANAIKIEGGHLRGFVHHLIDAGIPVVGHLGLTPQAVGLTGFRMQASSREEADELIETLQNFEALGVVMAVLEAIPSDLAEKAARQTQMPLIGIGAGVGTDGQVLVYHDVLKYGTGRPPRFVKQYGDFDKAGIKAIGEYISEVKDQKFPDENTTYKKKVYEDENNG